jgi:hypothetical protein
MARIVWRQQALKKLLRGYLDQQNAAAARLRGALPADPRKSPPIALAPAPDGGVVGRVDNLQLRLGGLAGLTLIATVRVARWDRSVTPLPSLVVEMRGRSFKGAILPGDWVQLPKRYDANRPLRGLTNLTRSGSVELTGKRVRNANDVIPLYRSS